MQKQKMLSSVRERILAAQDAAEVRESPDTLALALTKGSDGNKVFFDRSAVHFTGRSRIVIEGEGNYVFFAGSGKINSSRIEIKGNNSIIYIGDNLNFDGNKILIAGDEALISIGRDFRANFGTELLAKENNAEILIGDDCLFSTNIGIRTSDNHGIFDLATRERINFARDVHILDRVWIGEDAKVLKGVSIGPDAIVGAAAIVTKDVPSFCAVGGNPAKVVKQNIFWYKHFKLPK
jgi:acetyltransferase-like isoleucine patch superfamily enzyme